MTQKVIIFADRLNEAIDRTGTPCIVGLDPRFNLIPRKIRQECRNEYGETIEAICQAILVFNKNIIDIITSFVPAVKPQIAFYEMYGPQGIQAYLDTVSYAREKGLIVIADVKRNDIGSTVAAYSQAFLGEVPFWNATNQPVFNADAVTVNPYLGTDGIQPFLDDCTKYGKGIFVLVKTSNPSSNEFQNIDAEGKPLFLHVAEKCREWGQNLIGKTGFSSVGAVVGATYPQEAIMIRKTIPEAILLVPGFGFQGGKAEDLNNFFIEGKGAVVNSSRGIIHAYTKEPYLSKYGQDGYEEAIRDSLTTMITQVKQAMNE